MAGSDEAASWKGARGEKWAAHAAQFDTLLAPFSGEVLNRAALGPGDLVLDVGCGSGELSLQAAKQVGPSGRVLGIDISEPLLAVARERATEVGSFVRFEHADAAHYQIAPPAEGLISRFGLMFFDDPVAALGNLRRNVLPGGRLAFSCWQALAYNDWARAPLEAALPLLPALPPPPEPHAPGPFAFADGDRVAGLLEQAGWRQVEVAPWTGEVTIPADTPENAADFLFEMGPASRLVTEAGVDLAPAKETLCHHLAGHAHADGGIRLPAAAWIVSATAP